MKRQTHQRQVIRDTFEQITRPLSIAEVLEHAQKTLPKLGQATVYRAVNDLVAQGWLKAVELPAAAPCYERANLGHHHHFKCRACDRVYDMHGCANDLAKLAPEGFHVESHEIILFGLCKSCPPPPLSPPPLSPASP